MSDTSNPFFDPLVWYMADAVIHSEGVIYYPYYGNGHSYGNRYGNCYGAGALLTHYGDGQGYGDGHGDGRGKGTGYHRLRYAQYF